MDSATKTKIFVRSERHKKPKINFIPSQDFNWIVYESHLAFLPLKIKVPYKTIEEEIKNIESYLVEHRASEDHQGWKSFCIHGKSYKATSDDNGTVDEPLTWTKEALELMPQTVDFFKNNWYGNKFARLRVMKLDPDGFIGSHQDNPAPGRLAAVNIAITNPIKNQFAMKDNGLLPFEPGKAIMLNISNLHAVINEDVVPRYHIIAHHVEITEDFKKVVIDSYNNYIEENKND